MGRGCIMHYQKRRVPLSEPGSAGLMLLEAGAAVGAQVPLAAAAAAAVLAAVAAPPPQGSGGGLRRAAALGGGLCSEVLFRCG